MRDQLQKIKDGGFSCEAGPLENCVDFQQLERMISNAPEFHLGCPVTVDLEVIVDDEKYQKTVKCIVTDITSKFGSRGDIIHGYTVKYSKPQEYHDPKAVLSNVPASRLTRVIEDA